MHGAPVFHLWAPILVLLHTQPLLLPAQSSHFVTREQEFTCSTFLGSLEPSGGLLWARYTWGDGLFQNRSQLKIWYWFRRACIGKPPWKPSLPPPQQCLSHWHLLQVSGLAGHQIALASCFYSQNYQPRNWNSTTCNCDCESDFLYIYQDPGFLEPQEQRSGHYKPWLNW